MPGQQDYLEEQKQSIEPSGSPDLAPHDHSMQVQSDVNATQDDRAHGPPGGVTIFASYQAPADHITPVLPFSEELASPPKITGNFLAQD